MLPRSSTLRSSRPEVGGGSVPGLPSGALLPSALPLPLGLEPGSGSVRLDDAAVRGGGSSSCGYDENRHLHIPSLEGLGWRPQPLPQARLSAPHPPMQVKTKVPSRPSFPCFSAACLHSHRQTSAPTFLSAWMLLPGSLQG